MQRYERGLYGDPRDPEVRRHVMNMLDDAVVKDVYSEEKLDEAVARWENRLLVQIDIPPNPYDNDALHLKEHLKFQKSMDYQKIKLEDTKSFIEIEARFLKHNIVHQKKVAEQREQMLRTQMVMKGGQSGGSSGSSGREGGRAERGGAA
jgi:hypothetical protein